MLDTAEAILRVDDPIVTPHGVVPITCIEITDGSSLINPKLISLPARHNRIVRIGVTPTAEWKKLHPAAAVMYFFLTELELPDDATRNMPCNKPFIKTLIGDTWFDIDDDDDQLILESREFGDVGAETAGDKDVNEAKRIIKDVKRHFGDTLHISWDIVDEWVIITILKP